MDVADLFQAASTGDCDKIRSLLEGGLDVDAQDDRGCSALHHAAKAGHCPAMEVLLDGGVDIEATDKRDRTALHQAARYSHCAAIALLLDRGANLGKMGWSNHSALHYAASRVVGKICLQKSVVRPLMDRDLLRALDYTVEGRRSDAIKLLLDRGANADASDGSGCTPLHYAVLEGDTDTILLLLDRGSKFCHYADNNFDQTLLHMAALRGDNDSVTLFLDRGLGIDVEDITGRTALHVAGRTALHVAAKYGHHETVRLLCSRGANLAAIGRLETLTPLLEAARNGHRNVFDVALKLGATLAEKNSGENTALHLAIPRGGLDTVTHLLGLGMQANARNTCGETALHTAVQWSNFPMVEVLLMAGGDCNIKDEKGKMPEDLAQDPEGLCQFTDIHKLLLYHRTHYPNLQRSCRAKILRVLGRSRFEEVYQLPLPQILKDYLLFKDTYYCYEIMDYYK